MDEQPEEEKRRALAWEAKARRGDWTDRPHHGHITSLIWQDGKLVPWDGWISGGHEPVSTRH